MNKLKTLGAAVLVALITFSFTAIDGEKKEIKTDKSTVTWKGYKVTGSHYGTVDIQSGFLTFDQGKLTGGEFVVDMTTLVSNDLTGEYKGMLEGHLKSDDFFGIDKHPTAKLVFTKVISTGKNSYKVTGDLTIKGKSAPVTFDLSVYGNKATANVKIDRTTYDIRYGSPSFFDDLQDKAIYDEFDLVSDIEF
jgi:polyisoprenoid-binding protein YceI